MVDMPDDQDPLLDPETADFDTIEGSLLSPNSSFLRSDLDSDRRGVGSIPVVDPIPGPGEIPPPTRRIPGYGVGKIPPQ
jgi:hypothetical protein